MELRKPLLDFCFQTAHLRPKGGQNGDYRRPARDHRPITGASQSKHQKTETQAKTKNGEKSQTKISKNSHEDLQFSLRPPIIKGGRHLNCDLEKGSSTAPFPSADWQTLSLRRLASFCTASSPASCALCRNRRWRRQEFVRMFIFVGDPIGGSHGFPGWEPMGGHGVSCSPCTPSGFPGRLPDVSKSFLVS